MNMSVRALNPRIVSWSPAGTPPSPAWNVMPGDVAQHVAQRRRALLLDHGARNHRDRLRDVAQRLGQLRRGHDADAAGDFDTFRQLPNLDDHRRTRAAEIQARPFEDARQRVIDAQRARHAG